MKTLIKKLKALRIYAVSGSCECGEHSKCVRKIHSNSEGKLWVENRLAQMFKFSTKACGGILPNHCYKPFLFVFGVNNLIYKQCQYH